MTIHQRWAGGCIITPSHRLTTALLCLMPHILIRLSIGGCRPSITSSTPTVSFTYVMCMASPLRLSRGLTPFFSYSSYQLCIISSLSSSERVVVLSRTPDRFSRHSFDSYPSQRSLSTLPLPINPPFRETPLK